MQSDRIRWFQECTWFDIGNNIYTHEGGIEKQKRCSMCIGCRFFRGFGMKRFQNVGGYAYIFDEQGKLWISNMGYNGLVKCDITTKEIEYVKQFEGYALTRTNLHGTVRKLKNRLFFFPLASNHVHIYDIESEKVTAIEIPQEYGVTSFSKKIYECEDTFLLFPTNLNGTIWKIDSVKETVSEHKELTEFFNQYTIEERKNSAIVFDGNQMIVSLPVRKELLILDLISFGKKVISIESEHVIRNMVKKDNDLLATVSDTLDIYRINTESGQIEKYVALESAASDRERLAPYSDIVLIDKCIFASNYYAKNIFYMNQNGEVLNFSNYILNDQRIRERKGEGAIFCGIIEREENIYFIPGRASHLIEYNYRTGKCNCIEFFITKFRDKDLETEFVQELLSYQMEELLTLKDFLSIFIC